MARTAYLLAVPVLVLAVAGCRGQEQPPPKRHHFVPAPAPSTGLEVDPAKLALYTSLPPAAETPANPSTADEVALGKMLFFDARLSRNQDVACATCHDPDNFGVDGKDLPRGTGGQKGTRNAPTVYNAALAFAQCWDGCADTIEDQAKVHILSPAGMGMPGAAQVANRLGAVPGYVDAFKKAFPDAGDPVTLENAAKALGAFERKLITPSRWDRFLGGDKVALSDEEKRGFLAFVDSGCGTCHLGPLVGGMLYQKLGLAKPWPNQKDTGRERITKSASDEMMFKASSLRNIERTAPYFHDGSVKSLDDAVKMMGTYQLNRDLADNEVKAIVTWFKTLTGVIPTAMVTKPELPAAAASATKQH